jgi:predicted transcriptional regulator
MRRLTTTVTIRLPSDQRRNLRRLARANRWTLWQAVRSALIQWVKRTAPQLQPKGDRTDEDGGCLPQEMAVR